MKITLVGGASYAWTPRLVANFLLNPAFATADIVLMDPNRAALDEVLELCRRLAVAAGRDPGRLGATPDLDRALDGAQWVVPAISHGGLEAELEDHRIARRYGHYNLKGSEVGVAGASRTLRMVPELVRIARRMERRCPQAEMLNVTNPLTAITRAVNRCTAIRATGFCHGVVNHLGFLRPWFGAGEGDPLDFVVAGVDHCSWLLAVRHQGRDCLEALRERGLVEAARRGTALGGFDDPFAGRENQRLRLLIWDAIGHLPAISDEHIGEFFAQVMKGAEVRAHYGVTYDRIAERTRTVDDSRRWVRDQLAGRIPLALHPCGEILDRFIAARCGHGGFCDVLNTANLGQIANLPQGTVVETRCWVDACGVQPLAVGALPPILDSIVRPVALREELFVDAALAWDRVALKAALATDPLVLDFRRLDALVDELLAYNRAFLSAAG